MPNREVDDLNGWSDAELLKLRARLTIEMRRRDLSVSVGEVGESLAIAHYRTTSGLPNLQRAPKGTKNIDALSRDGERYSIKTVCSAKKTGTIYPDAIEPAKQLFEHVLIVQLREDWTLRSIHSMSWEVFVRIRSWDKRMNAWYIAISKRTLTAAETVFQAT